MKYRASALIRQIFDQTDDMRATVEIQTIVDSDRPAYEPALLGIKAIRSYNAFAGPRVESFLRERLMAVQNGPITAFRFGREYSPVLYLTVSMASEKGGTWVKHTPSQRRRIAQQLVAAAQETLQVDSAKIVSPGIIRLWWD